MARIHIFAQFDLLFSDGVAVLGHDVSKDIVDCFQGSFREWIVFFPCASVFDSGEDVRNEGFIPLFRRDFFLAMAHFRGLARLHINGNVPG